MNYSELLQLAKGWGNFVSDRINIWRLPLIRQGQGVSSIPLADEGMKDFQKIARKYGVDFAIVKDKNQNPPIYTVFFKAKDMDAITRILQDYSAKQVKKASVEKTSVLEKLKKFKEIVAAIPRKVAEKKKERSR